MERITKENMRSMNPYEKILRAYYAGLIRRESAIIYCALIAGATTDAIRAMFEKHGV